MEETTLITQILKGKTSAYAMLIDKYKDRVFALALRLSGNREDAEEIVQDVFLKVFESLAMFQGTSKFSTWIYRIAYNTSVSKLRSVGKHKQEVALESYDVVETKDLVGVLEPLKREEQKYFLAKALQQLKPEDSLIVELFYLDEMKIDEIVAIVDESISNVKVKLYRARKKLYDLLVLELQEDVDTLY
ncbi:RNA polymerase sigma-70 factor (ECF subfamily) [Balneicella halophila]|uniref:RNA polymerase sigma factor n=1 Tax=Balneicella halophila TaxID=1537566 RepID=A0A7L4UND0_BALHA|nr:sigma-70 family RNA polymerase sigma factor [Balneicella halophila]PVX50693.1 RNA polymerase sigma-70 factor (ECF subfamily) [Balneicella halophila]